LPGMAEVLETDNPGMHTTDTVDFDVILSGEIYLELDDGAEVLLKAGDCVVQNGTRHAWRNRSSENCVIAVTLVGAARSK
jgi:quercetin dioxygenase-like cupin family protein